MEILDEQLHSLSNKDRIELIRCNDQIERGRKIILISAAFFCAFGIINLIVNTHLDPFYMFLTLGTFFVYGLTGVLSYRYPIIAFSIAIFIMTDILIGRLFFVQEPKWRTIIWIVVLIVFLVIALVHAIKAMRIKRKQY